MMLLILCLSTVHFRVVTLDTNFSPVNQLVSWKYNIENSLLGQSLLFQSQIQKCGNTVMAIAIWYYVTLCTASSQPGHGVSIHVGQNRIISS